MTRKKLILQRLAVVAVLGIAECAGFAAVQAQDFPFLRSQRAPRNDGGFFGGLFGGGPSRRQDDRERPAPQQQYQTQRAAPQEDNSRAPPARRSDPSATTSVVVLGDSMADWLAYGLEDAFADAPEVGIVRKNKAYSGLIKYDARSDLDWWHVARDLLANEKPSYVVMMLGLGDRQNLRERDIVKDADKKPEPPKDPTATANPAAAAPDQTANKEAEDSEPSIVAPETASRRGGGGSLEFRGEQWEKIYTRRIDDTIAALKSKGVPVFWVGLPSIRGTRSTADAVYLNDLYRARAEKAGAVYIDVWDGFVDESGKYNNFGPDYEGQMRRLRSSDGVYFSKFGARKLAHYVEREIRRYMTNKGPVASLPTGPMGPVPDGKPSARPLAGPVVPLTMSSSGSEELLGGAGVASQRPDATALSVLVKGDSIAAPSGRADDFWWPRGSAPPVIAPVAAVPPASATAAISAPAVAQPEPALVNPEPVVAKPAPVVEPKPEARPKPAQPAATKSAKRPEFRPQQQQRAPQPVQQRRRDDGGLFGFIR